MSNRFHSYAGTATGIALTEIVDAPELVADFLLMSRMGRPAVQAVAVEAGRVIDALPTKAEKDAASQFCGWSVGQVMRGLGYRVVRERGRVTGAPFKTGAVWEPAETGVRIVRSLPADCTRRIELAVRAEKDGRVVGQWEAVQSAADPVRRIRTVVEVAGPVAEAIANATSYALRWDFSVILIRDPKNLYPTG
ncbi:hypothetical protein AB8B21_30840 [Tardiphaga sp. 866_E4_N2_1]|uniref:hypothetical protein n=1 Tax=unclassified Tardiphaga TaxID=2631404 RepID=UPI003F1F8F8E